MDSIYPDSIRCKFFMLKPSGRERLGNNSGIRLYNQNLSIAGMSRPSEEKENLPPSRRKFLKASVIAGATAAAVAAGAAVVPGFTSAAKKQLAQEFSKPLASKNDPIVVVIKGEELNIMQGERGVLVKDSSLASEISSQLR